MQGASHRYKVGIIGATGYTGCELARLLACHPNVDLDVLTSESFAGQMLSDVYPSAPALPLVPSADASFGELDIAYLCLPHAAAAETASRALEAGSRVIDLSADFRLRSVELYEKTYQTRHPAPEWLDRAVYGLTEYAREALPEARLVANPGCYPTTVLLALLPLVKLGVRVSGRVVVDAKSGVSGAGRKPTQLTHSVEVADNLTPYKLGRAHRHLPEMEQELNRFGTTAPELCFVPHLLAIPRGMLSTIYVPLCDSPDESALRAAFEKEYSEEPFVHLLPQGQVATVAHAHLTNRAAISLNVCGNMLIIVSVIDNLLKGASGQALQNMNVMLGLDETTALPG